MHRGCGMAMVMAAVFGQFYTKRSVRGSMHALGVPGKLFSSLQILDFIYIPDVLENLLKYCLCASLLPKNKIKG